MSGVEKVEDNKDDEDEIDSRNGRRNGKMKPLDEKLYKPRVYKWRLERKR